MTASFPELREGLYNNLVSGTDLNAYRITPDVIEPPAVIVGGFISIEYGAMRNIDRWLIPVRLYMGNPSEPAAQDDLDAYAGSTLGTIKAAIESDKRLGGVAQTLKVTEASRYGVLAFGGESFLVFQTTVEVLA